MYIRGHNRSLSFLNYCNAVEFTCGLECISVELMSL